MIHNTNITKDMQAKKLHVTREFSAPVEKVWNAWTDSSLLDKWWAPKPWKAVTKTMDFNEGGYWLYQMLGPDGTGAWCRVNYETIAPVKSYTATNSFCDENGKTDNSFPMMHWSNSFAASEAGTKVTIDISFDSQEDLEKIIAMGFEAGFTMGLGNLDELLAQ